MKSRNPSLLSNSGPPRRAAALPKRPNCISFGFLLAKIPGRDYAVGSDAPTRPLPASRFAVLNTFATAEVLADHFGGLDDKLPSLCLFPRRRRTGEIGGALPYRTNHLTRHPRVHCLCRGHSRSGQGFSSDRLDRWFGGSAICFSHGRLSAGSRRRRTSFGRILRVDHGHIPDISQYHSGRAGIQGYPFGIFSWSDNCRLDPLRILGLLAFRQLDPERQHLQLVVQYRGVLVDRIRDRLLASDAPRYSRAGVSLGFLDLDAR